MIASPNCACACARQTDYLRLLIVLGVTIVIIFAVSAFERWINAIKMSKLSIDHVLAPQQSRGDLWAYSYFQWRLICPTELVHLFCRCTCRFRMGIESRHRGPPSLTPASMAEVLTPKVILLSCRRTHEGHFISHICL